MRGVTVFSVAGLLVPSVAAAPGFWREHQFAKQIPGSLDATDSEACMALCQSNKLPCYGCQVNTGDAQLSANRRLTDIHQRDQPQSQWWSHKACKQNCEKSRQGGRYYFCFECDRSKPELVKTSYDYHAWEACMAEHGDYATGKWRDLCNNGIPPSDGAIYDAKHARLWHATEETSELARRDALYGELPDVGHELKEKLAQVKDHGLLQKANELLGVEKDGLHQKLEQGKKFIEDLFHEKEKLNMNAIDMLSVNNVNGQLDGLLKKAQKKIEELQNSLGLGQDSETGDSKDYDKALGKEQKKLEEIFSQKAVVEKTKSQQFALGLLKKKYNEQKEELLRSIENIQKKLGADVTQDDADLKVWDMIYGNNKNSADRPDSTQDELSEIEPKLKARKDPEEVEEAKKDLHDKHKTEIKKTKKEQKNQAKTLSKVIKAQIAILKQKHAEAVEELIEAHEDELKELIKKHEEETKKVVDEAKEKKKIGKGQVVEEHMQSEETEADPEDFQTLDAQETKELDSLDADEE